MVKLRDYFQRDLGTFFNTDEFAIDVEIERKLTPIVVDNDTLEEMQLSNNGEGLENSSILFHVKKIDLVFEPREGQDIMFDGSLYFITNVKEDEGVYSITIEVPES